MFWFEDPVAVSIEQNGELLAGTGCCAGLEGGTDFLQCCGALSGSVSGNQVAFEFEFGGPGEPRVYGTQVTVSEDGQRMGGTFILDRSGVGFDAAWVPLAGAHLGGPSDELRQALLPLDRSYELKLVSASAGRFEPLAVYRVVVSANGFVGGDFGVFYFGEMAWDATSATLRVGPVAATDPRFATQLELQAQGQPKTLFVKYPDEPPYVFSVADTE